MLQVLLPKSQRLLSGRLFFVRKFLLGQTTQPQLTVLSARVGLQHSWQKLNDKYAKKHTYHHLDTLNSTPKNHQVKTKTSRSLRGLVFTAFMSLSFALLVVMFGPVIYLRFFGHETVPVQATESGTVLGGKFEQPASTKRQISPPPLDENLPEGNWVIIPRIGVRTEILESKTPEESLVKGVWRVPDFGQPGDTKQPLILAAHRYGYNWWWKGEYWKYHSFYLLPSLQPGDLVEVISNKRKYLYEIYAGEEGTEITDYNADLILYTCKFLTSDIRHFRYARLIDPAKTAAPSSNQ